MPAPLQFKSHRDQWIDVAKGADVRQNNAHKFNPEFVMGTQL